MMCFAMTLSYDFCSLVSGGCGPLNRAPCTHPDIRLCCEELQLLNYILMSRHHVCVYCKTHFSHK